MDITVIISLDTQPAPKETLLPLILSTEGAKPYKEYASLAEMEADYPNTTKTHACAAALFGQAALAPAPIKACACFGVAEDATEEQITDALTELRDSHDDWYFLLPVTSTKTQITALAEWAAATVISETELRDGGVESEKLLVVQTDDETIRSVQPQTVLCYNHTAGSSYMHAAWVGRVAPNYPKAITWKWKALDGIPVTDLSGAALNTLQTARVNTYVQRNKRQYMGEGICANGDFIDTVISRWQLKAMLRQALTAFMVENEHVPYDNDGFTQVGGVVIQALNTATNNGIILAENGSGVFSVAIPTRADATKEQAATRTMPDIVWSATLLGGVHGVEVRGTLSVSLPGNS